MNALFLQSFIALTLAISAVAQSNNIRLKKGLILKTNLLSLVAQKPTITIEKIFSKSVSAEVSFVQGEFNNFLFTDHYAYNGFLIRAKKYFADLEFGSISPYGSLYVGNLKRQIQTTGARIGTSGYLGYPSRDFLANSIRAGYSFGLTYISKSRIVVDGLGSLGYGRYMKVYKSNSNRTPTGYLDMQVWLSVGYCF